MNTIKNLPFFLMMLGIASVSTLVPAMYALAIEEYHDARAFFYSGLIGLILTVIFAISLATRPHNTSALRQLVALLAPDIAEPELGTPLCELEEGDPVGRWMSSASLPDGQRLALGYLPKDFWAVGTELFLGDGAGPKVRVVGFATGD